jgi:hypothetical protein
LVEQYRKFWTQKLDALETYLEELQDKQKRQNQKRSRLAVKKKKKTKK